MPRGGGPTRSFSSEGARLRPHIIEPYRAWSNFEFIAEDGAIYEVDLLVVSPKGFFLIEIKSRGNAVGTHGDYRLSVQAGGPGDLGAHQAALSLDRQPAAPKWS